MKLNRMMALLLALMMVFAAVSLAEEVDGETPGSPAAGPVSTGAAYDYESLVIGHTTAMNGNFTTLMWGNNTADLDVRALVNGYNLISWSEAKGNFSVDSSVVSGLTAYDDQQGNRTYIITLYRDLKYSDETPINASDYAFSILLSVAGEVRKLGGNTENYGAILGMDAYRSGSASALAGLRILADNMLAITISAEYRPFFYELGLLMCDPMPIHVIAPGCQVKDNGEGAFIDGPFTAELLQTTLLDPVSGYVSHPSVVSGPYRLLSFDGVTAQLTINPAYKGNEDGVKPSIRNLTFTLAQNETMMDKLASGEFGLLNKVLRADSIAQGEALVAGGGYASQTYPRTGLSYISFCCEQPSVSSTAVRQAIALCMDKDRIVADYAGDSGLRVDGYYGLGQWMYQLVSGDASFAMPGVTEDVLNACKALSLDGMQIYNLDVQEAIRLLEEDGWTLNAAGQPFTPGTDAVRCKEMDGEIVALDLTLIYPEGNVAAQSLQTNFVANLALAGVRLTLEPVEFTRLLNMNYRREARSCDMIYMASNFTVVFDPTPFFDPADAATGYVNASGVADEELYRCALEMSATEPGDVLGYLQKWVAFQERFAQVLPVIPVYSNVYVDFHAASLHNYQVSENVTWSQAIVEAYLSDPAAQAE